MNRSLARRARARWIAVLTVLLVFAGAGAAAAYWTAQVQVRSAASAATPGLEQKLLPEGQPSLSIIYSAEESTAAGFVSVANTGTREADYTLTVSAKSDSDLASAIQVAVAPIQGDEECTPRTALDNAQLGRLSEPFTFNGTSLIERDESIVVCVQTSLTAADILTFAEEEIELKVSSALNYADGEEWKRESPAEAVVQSVAPDASSGVEEMFCQDSEGWNLFLEFSEDADDSLKNDIRYRSFLAHEHSPDVRSPYSNVPMSGWHTVEQIPASHADLVEFRESSNGGLGNTWLYVERKLPGEEEWTPVAAGKFHTVQAEWHVAVRCGWQ